jgi:hypothetical protein
VGAGVGRFVSRPRRDTCDPVRVSMVRRMLLVNRRCIDHLTSPVLSNEWS